MSGGTDTWTFKGNEIANTFDHHVRGQLPFYEMVLDSIVSLLKNFLPSGGRVTDYGCSTGNFFAKAKDVIKGRGATYYGIDSSDQMLEVFQKQNAISDGSPDCWLQNYDLNKSAEGQQWMESDVYVVNLTFMFLDPKLRHNVIREMIKALPRHGVIILVDKCRESKGYLSCVYQRMLWDFKSRESTLDEIVSKELSLRGVQIPESREFFLDLGFDEWFKYGNFSGFIYGNG